MAIKHIGSKMEIGVDEEFRNLIPPLSADEYAQLEANLKAEGCRDPLVTWKGMIIDGHNRFEICNRLGIGFEKISKPFTDRSQVIEWIIRNQFGRRNLSAFQRTKLALRLEESIKERAKANSGHRTDLPQKSAEGYKPVGETREEIAKLAGVSRDTVDKVKTIENRATPEIKEALAKGEISINKAHLTVKIPSVPKNPDPDLEPVVVDGTAKPVRLSPFKPDQAKDRWHYAKLQLDAIHPKDISREQVLREAIAYCEKRLKENN